MKRDVLRDIFRLAFSKPTLMQKTGYFFKGIVFFPFLVRGLRQAYKEQQLAASVSQAGDDIYPLF